MSRDRKGAVLFPIRGCCTDPRCFTDSHGVFTPPGCFTDPRMFVSMGDFLPIRDVLNEPRPQGSGAFPEPPPVKGALGGIKKGAGMAGTTPFPLPTFGVHC
jgi:hypothetical protein